MSIKKQYQKNNDMCKITFSLQEKGNNIVRIAGDFNNWDTQGEPMKKLKQGSLSQTISLPAGKTYQFKYLINDSVWANDPESDELVPNGFPDQYNSLIVV